MPPHLFPSPRHNGRAAQRPSRRKHFFSYTLKPAIFFFLHSISTTEASEPIYCTQGISSIHMVGTGVFRTPCRSTLFSSTRFLNLAALNHASLNPAYIASLNLVSISLQFSPASLDPVYFLTFPQHHPHNQRISSLHLNYENYARDIILSSEGFTNNVGDLVDSCSVPMQIRPKK